jgi:DNA-binding GntR family transcriptional regulator
MKKVSKHSISDQAYQNIKSDIVACLFDPGQWIAQSELADRYQVGLTPVREALRRLAQEGFVRAMPRMGYVVSPITAQDIHELYELRLILETAAARLAAERASGEDLKRIRDAAQTTYQYKDRQSYTRFLLSNANFHVSIAAASRNHRLAFEISRTMDELTRVFHLGLDLRDSAEEMRRDHQALAEALSAHDAALAEQHVRSEILTSRARVLEALQHVPSQIILKGETHDNPPT